MELLNSADMAHLVDRAKVSMGGKQPEGMDSMFETWGMVPVAVQEAVVHAAHGVASVTELVEPMDYAKAMVDSAIVGFVLGCLATQEVETRKQTDNNGE